MVYDSVDHFLSVIDENCFLLARHGETDWNSLGLLQGQQDRPLSLLGYRQRKNLFFRLFDVSLLKIFTSTLQRTIQTALPISEEKGLVIEQVAAFDEAKLGVFEGQNSNDFSDSFSQKKYAEFLDDEINVVPPGGGENLMMVSARIETPLKRVMRTVEQGNTLLIAHRNVNKMIIKTFLNLSFDEAYRVEHKQNWLYFFFPLSNRLFHTKIIDSVGEIEIYEGSASIDDRVNE